jgi:hypothetical protein
VDKIAIPAPYTGSSRAVCKQLRQIHKACGQWPWEFLTGRIPEVLDKDMLAPLVIAVQLVSDNEYGVTLSELTEWLMGQKPDWVLTSNHSADTLDWVMYTHDKRARRRRSTANDENESGRKSSRARKRQHSNNEVVRTPPSCPAQEPRQKKRWAGSTSSTANNEAENGTQLEPYPNPQPEFESESESESETAYVPQSQPEPELDHGMEMDVDDTNPNGNDDGNTNANVNASLNATNIEKIEVRYLYRFPQEQLTMI